MCHFGRFVKTVVLSTILFVALMNTTQDIPRLRKPASAMPSRMTSSLGLTPPPFGSTKASPTSSKVGVR